MKKITFLTAVAALFFLFRPTSGQEPLQKGIQTILEKLAAQNSEIKAVYTACLEHGEIMQGLPYDPDGNFFECNTNTENEDGGNTRLQMYLYANPKIENDYVIVSLDNSAAPAAAWLKCYLYDCNTKDLTQTDLPFDIPTAGRFDKDEFAESQNYWRIAGKISDDGRIVITASPAMSVCCIISVEWLDNASFWTYKRGIYDHINMNVTAGNAETEEYVKSIIRPNFQRINDTKNWTKVEKIETFDLSLEGATITYYYSNNELEKIVAKVFGETYNSVIEYYLLHNRLSFIYERKEVYTKYFMDEDFDINKDFELDETRWYIKDNVCFRAIGNEGKRLTTEEMKNRFFGNPGYNDGAYTFYQQVLQQ